MLKGPGLIWWYWLLGAIAGVILFGGAFICLPDLMLSLFNWLLYSNSATDTPFNSPARSYIIFAHRVLGAVMVGWGVSLLFILGVFWQRREPMAWYGLSFSVIAWFVPDTLFSLSSGFEGNAVLNLIFLVAFAIPLAITRKTFTTVAGRS